MGLGISSRNDLKVGDWIHAKPLEQLEVETSEKDSASCQFPVKISGPTERSPQPETLN